jgi:hypothetical protein
MADDFGFGTGRKNNTNLIIFLVVAIVLIGGVIIFIVNSSSPENNNCGGTNWSCTDWSSCSNNLQARTCTDTNKCGVVTDKPAESKSCTISCVPDNSCALNTCFGATCTNNCNQVIAGTKTCTVGGKENYLIITTNSLANSPSITKLKSLRSNYNIITKFVDGMTPQQIKTTITTQNSQTPLSYVVIIGSSAQIPSNDGNDFYYSDLSGDDIPDVAYGRIPFSVEENLANLINKEVVYENTNYYTNKKILLMAGDDGGVNSAFQTATFFENSIVPIIPSNWGISKAYYGCTYPGCMIPMNTTTGNWGCDINDPSMCDLAKVDIKADKVTLGKMNDILFFVYDGHGGNIWMPNGYFPSLPTYNFGVVQPDLNNKNKYFIGFLFSCGVATLNGDSSISMTPGFGNTGYFSTDLLYYPDTGAVALIEPVISVGGLNRFTTAYINNIKIEKTLGKAWLKSLPEQRMIIMGDPALTINA